MEHHTSRTLSGFLKKIEDYSTLSAKEIGRKGIKPSILSLIVRPLFTFSKMFFLRLGFLDGKHGLILSLLYSYYTFLKYANVWEETISKGD
jgi:hypothetical protein